MIRTLIFGAIAGYVGKKLYDEGKLDEFKNDLVSRYNKVRDDISSRSVNSGNIDNGIAVAPPPSNAARGASAAH